MGKLREGLGQIVMAYEKHADSQADMKAGLNGGNAGTRPPPPPDLSMNRGYRPAPDLAMSRGNRPAARGAYGGRRGGWGESDSYSQDDAGRWPDDTASYDKYTYQQQSNRDSRYMPAVDTDNSYQSLNNGVQYSKFSPPPIPPRPSANDSLPPVYSDDSKAPIRYQGLPMERNSPPSAAYPSSSTYPRGGTSLSGEEFLPVVIPQGAASRASRFSSPFARVYAPQLESYGISMPEFITFIDGLNEAFIASPAFQAMDMAGKVAGYAPSAIAQGVGILAQVGGRMGSAMTSIGRSRAFVAAANSETFLPKGLVARFCSTKDMMALLPGGGQGLSLSGPSDAASTDLTQPDAVIDPRKMYLSRLQGYVAPLTWDVSEQVMPNNWIKKMGAWQAQRQEANASTTFTKGDSRSDKEIQIQNQIDNYRSQDPNQMGKDAKKRTKEIEKLQKELKKAGDKKKKNAPPTQEEVLGTIKWIVITRHTGQLPPVDDRSQGQTYEELA